MGKTKAAKTGGSRRRKREQPAGGAEEERPAGIPALLAAPREEPAEEGGAAKKAKKARPLDQRVRRSKAQARRQQEKWESAGWRRVEVDDRLFTGTGTENPFGSMISLEELDGAAIADRLGDAPVAPADEHEARPKKAGKAGKRKQPAAASAKGEAGAPAPKKKQKKAQKAAEPKEQTPEQVAASIRKHKNKKRALRRKRREKEKAVAVGVPLKKKNNNNNNKGGEAASGKEEGGSASEDGAGQAPERDADAWDEFRLHPSILRAIDELGFAAPTEVQRLTLQQAVHGWKDVVAAAETGSGKTLAFGIPVLERILAQRARAADRGAAVPPGMAALILAPTRELALQVADHIRAAAKYTGVRVATVVGGMSVAKQERVLRYRPEVVVATPGRLWELLVEKQEHLMDTSNMQCLVLDEADRMVAKGHYPELKSILDHVQQKRKNVIQDDDFDAPDPEEEDAEEENAEEEEEEEEEEEDAADLSPDEDELAYFPPIPTSDDEGGEVEELDVSGLAPPPEDASEEEDEEDEEQEDDDDEEQEDAPLPVLREKLVRQVFVFSATLMMGAAGRAEKKYLKEGARGLAVMDRLADRLEFRGRPHIVDVVRDTQMASKLREQRISCLENEKDYFLYYVLRQLPGKKIVFCNAITCLRRLVSLFGFLDLPVSGLHAKMQQRQRLKNLDRFRDSDNAVLICSDVAARGLDVPDVDVVVHYQLPPSSDRYVHRSGRTARAGAEGRSIVLLAEGDQNEYRRLCRSLQKDEGIPLFKADRNLVPPIAKLVNLARKVEKLAHTQGQERQRKDWFVKNAEAMDMVLDDDLREALGMERDRHHDTTEERRRREADRLASMRAELRAALAKPLVPVGVSRSYLSRNAVLPDMSGDAVDFTRTKRSRKRPSAE